MSTEKTYQIRCGELVDTLQLAKTIGTRCRGGEVFELISDLGGGKTAFVRGLADGLGIIDEVSSPSFTINNSYVGKKLRLEHFDFYRLNEAGLLADQLAEDIFQPDTVVAVEWGDIAHDVMPEDRIVVNISVDDQEGRIFEFMDKGEHLYLFGGLV